MESTIYSLLIIGGFFIYRCYTLEMENRDLKKENFELKDWARKCK